MEPSGPSSPDVVVTWLRWDREAPGPVPPPLHSLLTDDERARVDRLLVEPARRELVVGRALLRVVVARATGAPLSSVRFALEEQGRPVVLTPAGAPRVNLSHCPGLLAVGVCDAVLGVDVERAAERRPGLVRRFFHPDEAAWVEDGGAGSFWRRFTDIWTLKEAVIKAHGAGLAVPLPSFSVVGAGGPADAVTVDGVGPLRLALLRPTGEHSLGLAVVGAGGPLRLRMLEVTVEGLARDAALDMAAPEV